MPMQALVTSHSLLTHPPMQHTPHNYSPNLSLSVGMDLDKLKVPPLSSLCSFRVGGAPYGSHSDMLYEVLSTTFIVKVKTAACSISRRFC